ncbi:MAG: hypothetical protein OET90_02780 [Desulfuromonadales bacterium]|nr:hypothetical protein [Desulfuromonadales bacterium]
MIFRNLIMVFCITALTATSSFSASQVEQDLLALAARVDTLETENQAQQTQIDDLLTRVATLEADVAPIKTSSVFDLAPYVSVDTNTLNGVVGPHVIFTGANVHVQSGSGFTYDADYNGGQPFTGLGNLILGYNEYGGRIYDRNGAHNLILGFGNGFSSYGGLVAGEENNVTGVMSATLSGWRNIASDWNSVVVNGEYNTASNYNTTVVGGYSNLATGMATAVLGGYQNEALGSHSTVSGGSQNEANGAKSSVSGGRNNATSHTTSTIGGGANRNTSAHDSWTAGSLFEAN